VVLLIVLCVRRGFFYRALTWPFLLLMGKVSYFFYLFHLLVNDVLHQAILHQRTPILDSSYSILVTLLSFIITLLAGILSFRYFESPLVRYSHNFKYLNVSRA
jgi:peptidoglycan/LPS O-acetylase OafA/YrhL